MRYEKLDKIFDWRRSPEGVDVLLERIPRDFVDKYLEMDDLGARIGRKIVPVVYGVRKKNYREGEYEWLAIGKVDGPRLDDYLESGLQRATKNKVSQLCKIYRMLGENLGRICRENISHGDLQLGNVVVGAEGPVIIDWEDCVEGGLRVAFHRDWNFFLNRTEDNFLELEKDHILESIRSSFNEGYHSTLFR